MRLALQLAERGRGYVEPNPMVGCLVLKGGKIIGRGYHRKFGGPHAEPNALRQAGPLARGATAFVTLEPCCHQGQTSPCTDALLKAGIRRVVVAMKDPNEQVAGRGLRILRKAGVRVDVGLLRREATELNAPFVKYHLRQKPYVILKWAQSIDGKIATRTGDSKWITSRPSRAAAHALRARVDAVLVGIGTLLADDPMLTSRLAKPRRTAVRIILDTNLRTPIAAKIVTSARTVPTLIVTARTAAMRKRRSLERAGCEVVDLPTRKGRSDLGALLNLLHARGMTNILVEGGGCVLGAFVDQNLADEARIFVAPRLIGGEAAPGPLHGRGAARMRDLIGLRSIDVALCGPDLCYTMKFR